MANTNITNKQARFDYEILDEFEAGLVLSGDEIKAIRSGRANLKGSYGKIFYSPQGKPEVFLVGSHFHTTTVDPYRTRKLLLNRREINSLIGKITEKRLTLVPLKIFIKKGRAKLSIAVGRGKKLYDKREIIKARDIERSQGLTRP
jgi:SsrA-binding protein